MSNKGPASFASSGLGFHSGRVRCDFPVVVVTGACRSGKTLLANVLATCPEAEAADEPWAAMMLPFIAGYGLIPTDLASSWFATCLSELFNDLVLLRGANFRPTDLSTILTKKDAMSIFDRLINLRTRADVKKYAGSNHSKLLVTLAECSPFVGFILRAVPHARIVHVVRNARDVARDVQVKGWFDDEQLLMPVNAQLYRVRHFQGREWYVPCWVPVADEEWFLRASGYTRCLYYWCVMMESADVAIAQAPGAHVFVSYERLVDDPIGEFERISRLVEMTEGPMTAGRLREIGPRAKESNHPKDVSSELLERVDRVTLAWQTRLSYVPSR